MYYIQTTLFYFYFLIAEKLVTVHISCLAGLSIKEIAWVETVAVRKRERILGVSYDELPLVK